jgi:hypothetical protein
VNDNETPDEPQGDSEPTSLIDDELDAASGGKGSTADRFVIPSAGERDGVVI